MRTSIAVIVALVSSVAIADFCDYVDPFVGTAGTGHTFPGACVPFGMIQAGPDTGNGDWNHCSGYVFGDTNLYGFSQTHLNGTGCADLGDIRLLPFTTDEVPESLPMDKASEKASPGYYTVTAGGVKTEISATAHVASYGFTFPKGVKRRLLVDTQWGLHSWGDLSNRVFAADVSVTNNAIVGTLDVAQWNPRRVAFVVRPDHSSSLAIRSVTELKRRLGERAPRFVIDFNEGDAPVFVDVALSANSVKAADNNLLDERIFVSQAPNPISFGCLVKLARARWNEILERATIEGTDEQKRNWYTSLYHLCVQPNDISDSFGVSPASRHPFYSTFSTWDTFRAAGPLYTILMPDKAAEFVDSMLKQGEKTGYLPVWTLWGSENQCMIGTHSIPMIVDAWSKGVWKGDPAKAYDAIRKTLTCPHDRRKENWDLYDRHGYYPFDLVNGESVSRTLECAYDDWCAAKMATLCGTPEETALFQKRSGYWKNLFDPSILLMRSKDSKGAWRDPYDPGKMGYGAASDFTEGNAYQYTWHVMQDPEGLVAAFGGRDSFLAQLDALFSRRSEGEQAGGVFDVTGLIGQYVHGNEPSHHVIYFYSLLGEQNKTADRVREVFDRFYLPKPDGLCGNDDCGQMSAWYLFSAMGFYPFNPCGGDYVVGAPQVPRVVIKLKSEAHAEERTMKILSSTSTRDFNTFTITAKGLSKDCKHVKSMMLNGKPFKGPILKHSEIMAGGELVFEMCE